MEVEARNAELREGVVMLAIAGVDSGKSTTLTLFSTMFAEDFLGGNRHSLVA